MSPRQAQLLECSKELSSGAEPFPGPNGGEEAGKRVLKKVRASRPGAQCFGPQLGTF